MVPIISLGMQQWRKQLRFIFVITSVRVKSLRAWRYMCTQDGFRTHTLTGIILLFAEEIWKSRRFVSYMTETKDLSSHPDIYSRRDPVSASGSILRHVPLVSSQSQYVAGLHSFCWVYSNPNRNFAIATRLIQNLFKTFVYLSKKISLVLHSSDSIRKST